MPLTANLVIPRPTPPTREEYVSGRDFLKELTTSPIVPCSRCKWPRVHECACTYCGSVRL